MVRKLMAFSFLAVFVISLSGCATARRQKDLEIQGLRNQVSVLESQIQSKDEEINSLGEALSNAEQGAQEKRAIKKKAIGEVKSRPTAKHIQTALKNAGYNPGRIDGKMGKQTIDAIKAFQRANNISADGKVGKKTWGLLKEYLDKQVK